MPPCTLAALHSVLLLILDHLAVACIWRPGEEAIEADIGIVVILQQSSATC